VSGVTRQRTSPNAERLSSSLSDILSAQGASALLSFSIHVGNKSEKLFYSLAS
jgi:hypothetical protein